MRWGVVAGGAAFVVAAVIGIRIASNRGAAGGVDIALSNLPPGYSATHGAVAFNPVTGTAHMSDLVVKRDGVPILTAGNMDVTGIGSIIGGVPARIGHITLNSVAVLPWVPHVDRVEADGIESGTLHALLDAGAYPGGKPAWTDRRPVLGSLETFGLIVHVEPSPDKGEAPFDITVKHGHLDALTARQFAMAPTTAVMRQPEFAAEVLRAIAFHEESNQDIQTSLPGIGALQIGTVVHADYAGGVIGSETIKDVSFVSSKRPGTIHLDKVSMTGIDTTKLLDQWPGLATDDRPARQKFANALRVSGFSLDSLKMDFAKAPLITIESIDSHTEQTQGDFATGAGSMKNLNIVTTGRDLPPASQQALRNFGMADFSVNLDAEGSFDRGTGHMVVKREDLVFKGLGALHANFDIDGLKADSADPQANPMALLQGIRLIHAEFRWDDASLTQRLFHMAALRSGQSEDALRETLALPLASAGVFFPDQPDVADQINAFLDGRHTLDVTLAPATPVSFADVTTASPTEKAHLLGARIKGN